MLLRNLTRRKLRLGLSVLGVALSIGSSVALLGVSLGLVGQVASVVAQADSHLTVVQRIPTGLSFGYLGTVSGAVVDGFRGVPGVARVSPLVVAPASVTAEVVFFLFGVEPDGPAASRVQILSGRRLGPADGLAVILGRRAAEGMGKAVGEAIRINSRDLPIVGIFQSGVGLEDGGAMMPLGAAREFLRLGDGASMVTVKAADPAHVPALRAEIERRFPEVTAITSDEFVRDRLNLDAAVQAAWAVSAIALLLSALAVTNTMATAAVERTREVGILLAVGWSRSRILAMFLGEALLLSLLGGVLGLGLGTAALRALSEGYKTLPIPAVVPAEILGGAVLLALAVGGVGGALPAWRASRLDPVAALRAE